MTLTDAFKNCSRLGMLSSTPSRLNLGSRKDRFSTGAACRLAQVLALASLVLPAPGSEPPVPFEVSFKSTPGDDKEKSFQLRQASDAKDIFDIIPVVGDEWKTWPYFLHVKQEGRSVNDFLTFEVWRGNRTLNRAVKHDVRHVDQSRAGRKLDVTLEFFNAFVPISVRKIRQTLLFDITNESPWPLSLPAFVDRVSLDNRISRSTLEVIVRFSRTKEERILIQDHFPMGLIPPGKHFQVQVPTNLESNPSIARWSKVEYLKAQSSRVPLGDQLATFDWKGAEGFLKASGKTEHLRLLSILQHLINDGPIEPFASKLAPMVLAKPTSALDIFRQIMFYSMMAIHDGDTSDLEADSMVALRQIFNASQDDTKLLMLAFLKVVRSREIANRSYYVSDGSFFPETTWNAQDGRAMNAAVATATRDDCVFLLNNRDALYPTAKLTDASQALLALAALARAESLNDFLRILAQSEDSHEVHLSWLPTRLPDKKQPTMAGAKSWLRLDATRKIVDSDQWSGSGSTFGGAGSTTVSSMTRTYRYVVRIRNDERDPIKNLVVKLRVYKSIGAFAEETHKIDEIGVFEEKVLHSSTEETLTKMKVASNSATIGNVTVISSDWTESVHADGGRLAGVWIKAFVEGKIISEHREMPGDLKPILWQTLDSMATSNK